jgi:hypothetical protein
MFGPSPSRCEPGAPCGTLAGFINFECKGPECRRATQRALEREVDERGVGTNGGRPPRRAEQPPSAVEC